MVDQFVFIPLRWPIPVFLNVGLDDGIALFLDLEASGHKGVDVIARTVVDEILETDLVVLQVALDVLLNSAGDEESERDEGLFLEKVEHVVDEGFDILPVFAFVEAVDDNEEWKRGGCSSGGRRTRRR